MAGRCLAFSSSKIQKLLIEHFIPVTGDDWYQRRRQDAEGEFFRKVSDQGPRGGEGDGTRQGLYCFTASGKLLGFRNAADPGLVERLLKESLAAWKDLPSSERVPRHELEAYHEPDADYDRPLPKDALVLRVHSRELDERAPGKWKVAPGGASRVASVSLDHLWLRKEEWEELLPTLPQPGQRVKVPGVVARRIARFHLVDATRGEPPMWESEEIQRLELELIVEEVEREHATLRIEGRVHLETAEHDRGYTAKLGGTVECEGKKIVRFDLVAIGKHWGEGTYTKGAREGHTPLGVAFVLVDKPEPRDLVPPQAARWLDGYWRAE